MRKLVIKTLPSKRTWVDRDEIMLHVCFQILVDYIEIEKGDIHCNYEAHKEFIDELRFLYNWWKFKTSHIQNLDDEEQCDEMLLRLMKIRKSLWT